MTDEETLKFLNGEEWIDEDLRSSGLSHAEQSGLQVYRNYSNSFERFAVQHFQQNLSDKNVDLEGLRQLNKLLAIEDIRFLPIIFCSYTDELLQQAFKAILPDGIPGGRNEMLGSFGPLSDLSKRIRMAYAFDVLSADLMIEIDKIRKVRNRISHDWNLKSIADMIRSVATVNLPAMEPLIEGLKNRLGSDHFDVNDEAQFRICLIWLSGRLTYEANAYHKAKALRLPPQRALYEGLSTDLLRAISTVCSTHTDEILRAKGP